MKEERINSQTSSKLTIAQPNKMTPESPENICVTKHFQLREFDWAVFPGGGDGVLPITAYMGRLHPK